MKYVSYLSLPLVLGLTIIYYILQKFILVEIWANFLQTGTAIDQTFYLNIGIGILLLCLGGVIILNVVLLIRKFGNQKKVIVKFLLILSIPILGILISGDPDHSILKGLKRSFQKKNIDVNRIQNWLSTVDITEMQLKTQISCESTIFTDEIKKMLASLNPEHLYLNIGKNGKAYLDLCYLNMFLDFGIAIGVQQKNYILLQDEMIDTIDLRENAFIWLGKRNGVRYF